MFSRCAILIPDGVDPGAALAVARAVVAPGGRVSLVGWHRPGFWHLGDLWAGVESRVAGAEAALEAAAGALRGEGFRAEGRLQIADDAPADAVPDDAELVVVPAEPLSEAGRRWTSGCWIRGGWWRGRGVGAAVGVGGVACGGGVRGERSAGVAGGGGVAGAGVGGSG
ncbi:MAG: hypothetical protein R3F65_09175 [bacterium]